MSPSKKQQPALRKKTGMENFSSAVNGFFVGVAKWLTKDMLATFLLFASIALAIVFFSLLSSIQPESPGTPTDLSNVTILAQDKQITNAVLLDHDSRVVVTTRGGDLLWAAYPSSDSQTNALIRTLTASGSSVIIDQQSYKGTRQILVQFLIPILLLVCLFAYFTRIGGDAASSGYAAFSKWAGKGKKKGAGSALSFDNVAGAGEAVAELREIRDYLADPTKYTRV